MLIFSLLVVDIKYLINKSFINIFSDDFFYIKLVAKKSSLNYCHAGMLYDTFKKMYIWFQAKQ